MSVNISNSIQVDSATVQLSEAIVMAVAEAEGVDPIELDPLYDVVDPDALDALFRPKCGGTPRGEGRITLRFEGHTVLAWSDGTVEVATSESGEAVTASGGDGSGTSPTVEE